MYSVKEAEPLEDNACARYSRAVEYVLPYSESNIADHCPEPNREGYQHRVRYEQNITLRNTNGVLISHSFRTFEFYKRAPREECGNIVFAIQEVKAVSYSAPSSQTEFQVWEETEIAVENDNALQKGHIIQ